MCADSIDGHIRISESTALGSLKKFCKAVDKLFSEKYLRKKPTDNDVARLYQEGEERGFPGMLGSC